MSTLLQDENKIITKDQNSVERAQLCISYFYIVSAQWLFNTSPSFSSEILRHCCPLPSSSICRPPLTASLDRENWENRCVHEFCDWTNCSQSHRTKNKRIRDIAHAVVKQDLIFHARPWRCSRHIKH